MHVLEAVLWLPAGVAGCVMHVEWLYAVGQCCVVCLIAGILLCVRAACLLDDGYAGTWIGSTGVASSNSLPWMMVALGARHVGCVYAVGS
jgi:hypothetical protein